MHNMEKTTGELHALLIEYEKGLPKKAATPQVMAIQGSRIQKANKKSFNAKGNGKGKGKGKDKPGYIPKPKNSKPSTKEHPTRMKPATTTKRYGDVGRCEAGYPYKPLQQRSVKCIFIGYPKEIMGYYFPPENKIIVARYAEFLEKIFCLKKSVGGPKNLKKFKIKIHHLKNTSEIPMEVEGFEPPQDEVVPVRRSTMIHRAPDRLCLKVEVEEH
ncbi:hypothetical protein Tco_0467457 [Tanacetum coccineum]